MKAILLSTFKETLRRKAFLIMSIVSALYLVLWAVLLHNASPSSPSGFLGGFDALRDSTVSNLLLRVGMQFSSMLICLLTINLGSGIIASELESGLVLSIISRPVRRSSYVLGKYLGILLLIVIFSTFMFFMLLAIGAAYSLSSVTALTAAEIIPSLLFYLSVPASVLCLTTFGSVLIKAVPNGLLVIFIYILGNISGMVEMIGNYINNVGVANAGVVLGYVSPFNTLYSTAEQLLLPSQGFADDMMLGMGGLSGGSELPGMLTYVYIAAYSIILLLLAVQKFKKTDISV